MVSAFLILDENLCIQRMDSSAQENVCLGTASPFDHEGSSHAYAAEELPKWQHPIVSAWFLSTNPPFPIESVLFRLT